jgi:hypothetical protein
MGTEILLKIRGVSLDYPKSHIGNDYGFLFQDGDEARRRSDSGAASVELYICIPAALFPMLFRWLRKSGQLVFGAFATEPERA